MLHPRTLLLTASLWLMAGIRVTEAQNRTIGPERFVVDIVTLKTREQFRGALLGRSSDSQLQFAVQRDWLKKQHPKLFETTAAAEAQQAQASAEQFVIRLKNLISEQPESAALRAFLELELERAEKQFKQVAAGRREESQFFILELSEARVRSLITQAPQNRAIGLLAWRERLPDVEKKDIDDLKKELTAKGTLLNEIADLSDRLPKLPQDDREWAARRAILESQFGLGIEYQGLGDTLFETTADAPKVDWSQLVTQMFEKQLKSQLSELLGESKPKSTSSDAGLQKAMQSATAKDQRSIRVTQIELDASSGRVTVIERFFARMPNNTWEPIWQETLIEDASKPRDDLERRIETDPQIKELKQTLAALGLEQELKKALSFGAATMAAQKAADVQFNQFRDRYARTLDGPPLRWSSDRKNATPQAK